MKEAKQVVRNGNFEIPFAPESVMPLFTPEGHRKWVEGWDAKPVFPAGSIEYFPNSVFITGRDSDPVVWTILEAAHDHAEYIHTMGASAVGRIRVQATPASNGCRVSATFIVTALDARGEEVLTHFTEAAFKDRLANWQKRLQAVLSQA
jgi:hypothetical protein